MGVLIEGLTLGGECLGFDSQHGRHLEYKVLSVPVYSTGMCV